MTQAEKKQITRVCGKNYNYWDIPTFLRIKDAEKDQVDIEDLEREQWLKSQEK